MPYIESDPVPKTKSMTPASIKADFSKGGITFQVTGLVTILTALGYGAMHIKSDGPVSVKKIDTIEKEVSAVKIEVVKIQQNQIYMKEQIQEIKAIVQNPYRKRVRHDPNPD
jgi:hypothetical protein